MMRDTAKRLLSLLMIIVLVLGVAPAAAAAEESESAVSGDISGQSDESADNIVPDAEKTAEEAETADDTGAAPVITAQPQDADVKTGGIAVFTVAASGEGLTYRWQYSDDGERWKNCVSDGSDTASFSFKATMALNGRMYRCSVTGSAGVSVTSDAAVLTVRAQDFAGTGSAADPYLLKTADDLTTLASRVNGGESFSGVYFKMTADITLPSGWTPIGALKPGSSDGGSGANLLPFSGVFDGGGRLLTVPSGYLPLFGYVRGAEVRNISLYGTKIAADGFVANYVVDYGDGGEYSGNTSSFTARFENVTIKSGTKTLRSGFIGGMDHVENNNEYSQTSSENSVYFVNCTVESGVTIGYDKKQSGIGSFAGDFNGTMENCVSYADVYGIDCVGGLIGRKSASMGDFSVTDSAFHGTVTGTGSYIGGIVGSGYDDETAPNTRCVCIENCECDGTVTGGSCVGGIFGGEGGLWQAWDNGIAYIRANSFTGKVSGESNVGGVIGFYRSLNRYTVIENNSYVSNCGADTGIGGALYVDSSIYANGREKPLGWVNGVYCFDTSEDSIARIKYDLNRDSGYYNIARTDHNRFDDPLGADAEDLCYAVTPPAPSDPADPADPTKPEDPTDPTDPTKPEDPTDPVDPANPEDPADPADPTKPEEPQKARTLKLEISGDYKTDYIVGEGLDVSGMVFAVTWSDGTTTNPAASEVKFSGFDSSKPGSCTFSAKYGTASTFIKVNVEPASNTIKVTVAVYGDYLHDSDSDGTRHGLAMGGLSAWVSPVTVEADTSDTVWDVLQRVFSSNGITARTNTGSGSVYVAGLSYAGVSLGEFDNGVNSGWMYTLNGSHPLLGVSQQYLHDGDTIVFHYTDDYTKEQGSEGYNDNDDESDGGADRVKELIDAIGSPVTESSRGAVEKARLAYDALDYSQKQKVDNYSVLTAAEKALEDLKTAEDKKAAQQVIDAISALSADAGMSDKGRIEAARAAYDALTDVQKALVTNYEKLTVAERTLAEQEATEEDKKAAEAVQKLIDAIAGDPTGAGEEEIEAARRAYDALTDLQKKLIKNLEALEKAKREIEMRKSSANIRNAYETTGDYLESLGEPLIGAVGGEWMVIGLIRSGRQIKSVEDYIKLVEEYVTGSIDSQERLHRAKSTDNSRMILALTAVGGDVTDIAGHNLLMGLTDMEFVKKQGINGPSWALIAFDSGAYEIPENPDASDQVTREKLIAYLLEQQLPDGGWALSGEMSDSDMTGMILQALAPYYNSDPDVKAAVDRALDTVSRMQNTDGSFSAFGGDGGLLPTSESISQIIVALSALGIDCGNDERFIKNGVSAVDALCAYFVDGGGFRHVADGELDGMATEQGYYALTAYFRMLEGKTALYDMTDIFTAPVQRQTSDETADEPETAEEPEAYEEIAVAAAAAETEEQKSDRTVLIWGMPLVAAVGVAVFFIDKKRRSAKR